ncbi:transport and Golgi organization protein 1 homolog isoform 1-T1 [Clarias gariepinus]
MTSSRFNLFLLFICTCCWGTWSDRRFSDFKRCADEECSMLLCRGKASLDFTGPDCRFLSFKKGETIYVYYKLSGQRSDVWAGSVGNSFGYFPKELLKINHVYTDKEIEVPAEETDFVCFDTGRDKFESYDIDVLLGNSFSNEVDEPSKKTGERAPSEDTAEDREREDTSKDIIDSESMITEDEDEHTVEKGDVRDPGAAQLPLETTSSNVKDKDDYDVKKSSDADSDQEQARDKGMPDKPSSKDAGVLEKSVYTTPVEAFSKLKTTLGTTFDAVTSDDEKTQKVSPYEDEDEDQHSDSVKPPAELEEEVVKKPALLTFEETNVPDATESAIKQEGLALSEDAAKNGEREYTQRKIVHSDSSHTEQETEAAEDHGTAQVLLEATSSYVKDEDGYDVKKSPDVAADSNQEQAIDKDTSNKPSSKDAEALQRSDHTTRVEAFSSLKTTLGTTFDAVTSDDEVTRKVSPDPDEDQSRDPDEDRSRDPEEDRSRDPDEDRSRDPDEDRSRDPDEDRSRDPDEDRSRDPDEDRSRDPDEDRSSDPDEDRSSDPDEDRSSDPDEDRSSDPDEDRSSDPDEDRTSDPDEDRTSDPDEDRTSDPDEDRTSDPDEDRTSDPEVKEPVELEEQSLKEPSLLTFEETSKSEDKLGPHQPSPSVKAKKDDGMWSTLGDTVFKIVSGGERMNFPEDDIEDDDEEEEEEEEEAAVVADAHSKTDEKGSDELQTISVPDSGTSKVQNEKRSINDFVINSLDDNTYSKTEKQNTILKSKELEEIQDKSVDPDDIFIEPESDSLTSELENENLVLEIPVEKHLSKSIQSGIQSGERKPEAFVKESADVVTELNEQPDEQINAVKKDIIGLFENTLKREQRELDIGGDDEEDVENEIEELLEDENALLSTDKAEETEDTIADTELKQNKNTSEEITHDGLETLQDVSVLSHVHENVKKPVNTNGADDIQKASAPSSEPEYSDSVMRLTLLRDHFKDKEIERILRHLSLKDLYKIEAMFTDLDDELKSTRQSHFQNSEDLEITLENILEVSGNLILDEIDKIQDAREQRALKLGQQLDQVFIDEQDAILDDFQEFVFHLHQKYSERVPLSKENLSVFETAENVSEDVESPIEPIPEPKTEVKEMPEVPQEASELFSVNEQEDESNSKDVGPGEDSGHFNKNEDVQAAFQEKAEIQRGPQAILDNPLDISGFEIDPSSDSLDSSRASDFSDNNANYEQASTSTLNDALDFFLFASEYLGVYAGILMAALPEEWQPGPTFHGLPWKPVVATAVVGVLTVLVFMWRTVLAVKNKTYLLTEKQLAARIQQLLSEKSDVLHRVTELNNAIKEHEEKLNNSEDSRCSLQKQFNKLETHYKDLNSQKEKLSGNFAQLYEKIAKTKEENKTLNEKISIMHQGIQKYEKILKLHDEERTKIQVLMDEAKFREDALKAQVLSFEKDNCALKEQKKSLLRDAKDWQEKHEKLSEEIKVYQKTQTELEKALVHKENEMDVLTECIAELKSLESHNDTELENDKNGDPLKLHLKQMMDVSRIKATLSVIEEERNRWFENFMTEQKARQELEEQFQKVIHDQTNLNNEKTQLENQYKNLQQRLEITTELYHQKENILHQKLTQEELERHEKETKLSEVDGRAMQAEEELRHLRQKVKDMQEEMQQNERTLKGEIAVQEKKAHENWLKARASERALIEEKRECANLRQKIVECSDKMSDLERSLYRSGPADRHMPHQQRGDSYGPSPVSGGAPSPPLMMEDPGRPPSGPVGRRSEPFGPRLLLDGHSRSADLGHPLPFRPELSAPRTSSPCTQDGPPIDTMAEVTMQTSTDPTEAMSKSQRQGSFLPSPIRDSPVPAPNPHQKVYGPQPMGGPLPLLNGPLPPAIRPPNGHSPMMPPFGPDTGFRPPHMDSYRPPFPLRPPFGPIPPRFAHGPPLRDFPSMNPHPPAHGIPDFPPNYSGPQDLPFPHRPFPSGPLPPPGAMVPPSSGAYGPAPPAPQQPRDGQKMLHATDVPPEQRAAQDAPAPAVTQS